MKEIFISIVITAIVVSLFVACAPGGAHYDNNQPIRAIPVTVESTDGSRYQCQGIISDTYGAYRVADVFACQEIKK